MRKKIQDATKNWKTREKQKFLYKNCEHSFVKQSIFKTKMGSG